MSVPPDTAVQFELSHYGGYGITRLPLKRLTLYADQTMCIDIVEEKPKRCSHISREEFDDLTLALRPIQSQAEFGEPYRVADTRGIWLSRGDKPLSIQYEGIDSAAPFARQFIRTIDRIAQRHFGRLYAHSLIRTEP